MLYESWPARTIGKRWHLATAPLSCADVCSSHGWRPARSAGPAQPQTASSSAVGLLASNVVIASLELATRRVFCNTARLAQTQPSRELLLQEYVTGRCSGRLNANTIALTERFVRVHRNARSAKSTHCHVVEEVPDTSRPKSRRRRRGGHQQQNIVGAIECQPQPWPGQPDAPAA